MDDRAKIVQYFTRPVNGAGDIAGAVESIKIEEMFGKCWGVPCQVFISTLEIKVIFFRDFYLISVFVSSLGPSITHSYYCTGTRRHRKNFHVEIHVHEMGMSRALVRKF